MQPFALMINQWQLMISNVIAFMDGKNMAWFHTSHAMSITITKEPCLHLPWHLREDLARTRIICWKCSFWLLPALSILIGFESASTCCPKQSWIPINLHGIICLTTMMNCHFPWWQNGLMMHLLNFTTFYNLQDIITWRREMGISGHCPLMHSWVSYVFTCVVQRTSITYTWYLEYYRVPVHKC